MKWITWRGRHIPIDEKGNIVKREKYQYDMNKKRTDKAYDKYVLERDREISKGGTTKDSSNPQNKDKRNKVSKYKDKYLEAYNKENDRNNAIINSEEVKSISGLKGKHIAKTPKEKAREIDEAKRITETSTNNLSSPREAVNYYLKKGEFSKADQYMKDYGLEDEKEMFLEGQNYKVQADYKKYSSKNDISPMSEFSDTTGKGISDRQNKSLSSMSMSGLRQTAQEFGINTTGLSKQQLIAKIIAIMNNSR